MHAWAAKSHPFGIAFASNWKHVLPHILEQVEIYTYIRTKSIPKAPTFRPP